MHEDAYCIYHEHTKSGLQKKDKSLVERVGGGPLQLLRIILATGGIAGWGWGPSSLVSEGSHKKREPDSAK